MDRGSYDTRAPSASSQIICLERLLDEAEKRNVRLREENKRLREALDTLRASVNSLLADNKSLKAALLRGEQR